MVLEPLQFVAMDKTLNSKVTINSRGAASKLKGNKYSAVVKPPGYCVPDTASILVA